MPQQRMKPGKHSGQSMVEFMLIIPVLMISFFAIMEIARVLHAWIIVEQGARMGVRYAITMEYDPAHCLNGSDPDGTCSNLNDIPNARVASIHDVIWDGATSILHVPEGEAAPDDLGHFHVFVCDPAELVSPTDTYGVHTCQVDDPEDPGEPGDRVAVLVKFNHSLVTPLLSSIWPQLRLTSARQSIVEGFRIARPVNTLSNFDTSTPAPTNTLRPTSTSGSASTPAPTSTPTRR